MARIPLTLLSTLGALLIAHGAAKAEPGSNEAIDIGSRLEPFVDRFLIESTNGVDLRMHRPVDRGPVVTFDKPWEGPFAAYATILHSDGKYQLYYRGSLMSGQKDTDERQVICYAESDDGVHWTKPALSLFPRDDEATTNIILANAGPDTHNFAPMLDSRPGVDPTQKYKAIGGYHETGLRVYASSDGVHWARLRDDPVLTQQDAQVKPDEKSFVFDSQNVPFWSTAESKYLLYYRIYRAGQRRIARIESDDFLQWRSPVLMEYRRGDQPAPIEQLYTSQTHPYFRAAHVYIATAARFMQGRRLPAR